jgi:hypothetical protein
LAGVSEDFRITFFFGPAEAAEHPDVLMCVFNVKKRSWKGGVQVAVEVTKPQLERLQERGQLDELVEMIRAKTEPNAFGDYQQRARDLFVQEICRMKLDLMTERGLAQENQTIAAEALSEELNRALGMRAEGIRLSILRELDV